MRTPRPEGLPPLTGGLVGFIGYDAVRRWERLPDDNPDELGLPETAATALRDTLIDCTTAEGLWMDPSRPAPLSSDSDEARHRAAGGKAQQT